MRRTSDRHRSSLSLPIPRWLVFFSVSAAGCDLSSSPPEYCELQSDCSTGSCLVQRCVEDGSLEVGSTCLLDQQCVEGSRCFGFRCLLPCDSPYASPACVIEEYCAPYLNDRTVSCELASGCDVGTCEQIETGDLYCRFYEGGCTPQERCAQTTNEGCPTGEVCVRFDALSTACLPECEVSWSGGVYGDNCGGAGA